MTRYLIKDLETDAVVHEVITSKGGAALDRVEAGLYQKLDHDRYYLECDYNFVGAITHAL